MKTKRRLMNDHIDYLIKELCTAKKELDNLEDDGAIYDEHQLYKVANANVDIYRFEMDQDDVFYAMGETTMLLEASDDIDQTKEDDQ